MERRHNAGPLLHLNLEKSPSVKTKSPMNKFVRRKSAERSCLRRNVSIRSSIRKSKIYDLNISARKLKLDTDFDYLLALEEFLDENLIQESVDPLEIPMGLQSLSTRASKRMSFLNRTSQIQDPSMDNSAKDVLLNSTPYSKTGRKSIDSMSLLLNFMDGNEEIDFSSLERTFRRSSRITGTAMSVDRFDSIPLVEQSRRRSSEKVNIVNLQDSEDKDISLRPSVVKFIEVLISTNQNKARNPTIQTINSKKIVVDVSSDLSIDDIFADDNQISEQYISANDNSLQSKKSNRSITSKNHNPQEMLQNSTRRSSRSFTRSEIQENEINDDNFFKKNQSNLTTSLRPPRDLKRPRGSSLGEYVRSNKRIKVDSQKICFELFTDNTQSRRTLRVEIELNVEMEKKMKQFDAEPKRRGNNKYDKEENLVDIKVPQNARSRRYRNVKKNEEESVDTEKPNSGEIATRRGRVKNTKVEIEENAEISTKRTRLKKTTIDATKSDSAAITKKRDKKNAQTDIKRIKTDVAVESSCKKNRKGNTTPKKKRGRQKLDLIKEEITKELKTVSSKRTRGKRNIEEPSSNKKNNTDLIEHTIIPQRKAMKDALILIESLLTKEVKPAAHKKRKKNT